MTTGLIESWAENPAELGPLYPFVSFGAFFFAVCFVLWILYTLWQMQLESGNYRSENEDLSKGNNLLEAIESNRGFRSVLGSVAGLEKECGGKGDQQNV